MKKAMATVFAVYAVGGCYTVQAYTCLGAQTLHGADIELHKGKQLKHTYADGAPLFRNEADFNKWVRSASDGTKGDMVIGRVLPTDTVTALEEQNGYGFANAGWVDDSRFGRVFIYLTTF